MKKLLWVAGAALLLASGCGEKVMPAPLAMDSGYAMGISRDFAAVFESRDGTLTSLTQVVQSGKSYILKKNTDTGMVLCDNLSGQTRCETNTGALLTSDEADKIVRVEATTAGRLLGRQRALPDTATTVEQAVPAGLELFAQDAFTGPLLAAVGDHKDARTLDSCYIRSNSENKELFCFAGNLMPYWVDTTFTDIGNITLMRSLKGYAEVTLTPEQMQALRSSM